MLDFRRITSYGLVENDSNLVHGLLEIEGTLVGSSRTEIAAAPPAGVLSVNYDNWAKGQTFTTADVLVFNYGPSHSVDEVSQADYQNCNFDNPISTSERSPTSVPLTTAGTRYFLCPESNHCSGGMKLAVTVTSGNSTGTPPPPGTTPSPPGNTPSPPSRTTPSPPASGTTPSTPAPTPPSGDATVVLAGWNNLFVGVFVVVATLFVVIG
ncbi:uclacyanin-2-like [Dorcoceras hygrometricum]|uniref:Uclacyanin-2-like n=1 Tax=Dorcoceras hygrometricum TaxID=472368 RepID=A0A2Z7CGK9_9LAMI|nr:uclacyanin-2-like [Dorcoceras hygrometricum]